MTQEQKQLLKSAIDLLSNQISGQVSQTPNEEERSSLRDLLKKSIDLHIVVDELKTK